jgi:FtsZ-interacting cell division protein ZipA
LKDFFVFIFSNPLTGNDEEADDDDDDEDDDNIGEDIAIEEDDDAEAELSTTEIAEKAELRQQQHQEIQNYNISQDVNDEEVLQNNNHHKHNCGLAQTATNFLILLLCCFTFFDYNSIKS